MTGKETWDLIQPVLDPMTHKEFNNEDMAEAFCMTYIALKEYDENHEDDKKNNPEKCCKNCEFISRLRHNFKKGLGFTESYCCDVLMYMEHDEDCAPWVQEVDPLDCCEMFEKKS